MYIVYCRIRDADMQGKVRYAWELLIPCPKEHFLEVEGRSWSSGFKEAIILVEYEVFLLLILYAYIGIFFLSKRKLIRVDL